MIRNRNGRIVIGAILVAVVLVAGVLLFCRLQSAYAQAPPPPPGQPGQPPQGMPPTPGMEGRPFNMGPRSMMMPGMMGGPAAITAAGESVYVVQGNTLYQFNAKTLKLTNKAQLVEMKEMEGAPPSMPR